MKLIKILHNGARVYWDGREIMISYQGDIISLTPRAQVELVEVFEEITNKKDLRDQL